MPGTTVQYAGVMLYNCKTTSWEQEIVYDDSRTDVLCTRFKLRFECLLHAQAVESPGGANWARDGGPPIWTGTPTGAALSAGNSGDNSDACMSLRELTRRLWAVGADLKISMGDNAALQIMAYDVQGGDNNGIVGRTDPYGEPSRGYNLEKSWVNVENGPKPQRVSITQLTTGKIAGAAVFKLDFEIHAACVCCSAFDAAGMAGIAFVLNNRWSIGESMDANFFTTRTINGKMRVSSAELNHELARVLILPTVEPGFKREAIDFSVAADGLEVSYSVRDRQVYQSAPWPCTRMEGSHTESTQDGLTWQSSVQVEVEGHPGASKNAMLAWIIRVMENRLGDLSKLNAVDEDSQKTLAWVQSCVFTDHIGERNVMSGELLVNHTLQAKDSETNTNVYLKNLNAAIGQFGQPLELKPLSSAGVDEYTYDSKISHAPAFWGYDVQNGDEPRSPVARFFLACYLQSPCFDQHAIGDACDIDSYQNNENQSQPSASDYKPPAVTEYPSDVVFPGSAEPSASLSDANGNAAYSVARMETHYHRTPTRATAHRQLRRRRGRRHQRRGPPGHGPEPGRVPLRGRARRRSRRSPNRKTPGSCPADSRRASCGTTRGCTRPRSRTFPRARSSAPKPTTSTPLTARPKATSRFPWACCRH